MDAPELIDGLVADRVVVFGSLPPAGRDIDIVAREPELRAIDAGLRAAGFISICGSLLRFSNCSVEAVELVPLSDWSLQPEASAALFDGAIPLDGLPKVCRPAPVHGMLIAGRRLARERGRGGKAAGHFSKALAEDPNAAALAAEQAAGWGVARALAALRAGHRRLGTLGRLGALYEERRRGRGRLNSIAWALRRRLPTRPRRGGLIALSGLDGSGKSTQSAALAATLERLDYETRVLWVPMRNGPWLDRLAAIVKAVLGPILEPRARAGRPPRAPDQPSAEAPDRGSGAGGDDPVSIKGPVMTMVWSVVVTLRFAIRAGIVFRSEIWRGRVVICDRYLIDAWTYMRDNYQRAPSLRVQFALIRFLAPRPVRSFALIVDPVTASSRKPEYNPAQNARRSAYYDESIERLGAERIDGTLPREQICARIASESFIGRTGG